MMVYLLDITTVKQLPSFVTELLCITNYQHDLSNQYDHPLRIEAATQWGRLVSPSFLVTATKAAQHGQCVVACKLAMNLVDLA